MKDIKVYLKPSCPYCQRVKNYLEKNKLDFKKVDVSKDYDFYENLKQQTGHDTVPQIFIDGKFIGGSDNFFDLVESGCFKK